MESINSYLPVVVALVDILLHLTLPVMVGYHILFGRVSEYQEDYLPVIPVPLLLSVGFPVITSLPTLGLTPFPFFISHGGVMGVVGLISVSRLYHVVGLHSGGGTGLSTVIHISVCGCGFIFTVLPHRLKLIRLWTLWPG